MTSNCQIYTTFKRRLECKREWLRLRWRWLQQLRVCDFFWDWTWLK